MEVPSEDRPSSLLEGRSGPVEPPPQPKVTIGQVLELAHSESVRECLVFAAEISTRRQIDRQEVNACDIFISILSVGKDTTHRSATRWLYEWMEKRAGVGRLNDLLAKSDPAGSDVDTWRFNLTTDAWATLERARDISKVTIGRDRFDARHLISALALPDANQCNADVLKFAQDNLGVDLTKFSQQLIRLIAENLEKGERLEAWEEQRRNPTPSPMIIDQDSSSTRPDSETVQPSYASNTEFNTQFVPDDAEIDHDELGRGVLAVALARRVHKIWCSLNNAVASDPVSFPRRDTETAAVIDSAAWPGNSATGDSPFFDRHRDDTRGSFVLHLDAPWGGGKTTFANFLARVLNPDGFEHDETSFLRRRYGNVNISTIFLEDPPSANEASRGMPWPEDARRPWIIVPFNAWQVEHCTPPWWVFYQAIRQRCFASVLREGKSAVDTTTKIKRQKFRFRHHFGPWLTLWWREYWWRLTNPKVMTLLITALISLLLLALLYAAGIFHISGKVGEEKVAFNISNSIGLLLGGVTTIGSVWGFGALFTDSIIPGTNTLAERLSLGSGDPFGRFRKHFYKTMERVGRPVLVIVDDLDRCKPDFIVDLVRGVQTLLRSPRVVFLILGDRDWIERAFEAHHKAMNKVSVGPEQTFGARFVEKAIQMSFILPGMRKEGQVDYVRGLLLGRRSISRETMDKTLKPQAASVLREVIRKTAEAQKGAPLETEQIRRNVMSTYQDFSPDSHLAGISDERVNQFVNEELAIRAAIDDRVEQEISHRLEPLAAYFPSNPRQIKRIINAVTMYYAVALQQEGLGASDPRWFQLALWIIIMTEWPETWRLLASYPWLADLLQATDPKTEIKKVNSANLPGSEEATLTQISRIRVDEKLMALIAGGSDRSGPVLDKKAIEDLLYLTPLYSRWAGRKEKSDEKE
jgi:hypothetical protein